MRNPAYDIVLVASSLSGSMGIFSGVGAFVVHDYFVAGGVSLFAVAATAHSIWAASLLESVSQDGINEIKDLEERTVFLESDPSNPYSPFPILPE